MWWLSRLGLGPDRLSGVALTATTQLLFSKLLLIHGIAMGLSVSDIIMSFPPSSRPTCQTKCQIEYFSGSPARELALGLGTVVHRKR